MCLNVSNGNIRSKNINSFELFVVGFHSLDEGVSIWVDEIGADLHILHDHVSEYGDFVGLELIDLNFYVSTSHFNYSLRDG